MWLSRNGPYQTSLTCGFEFECGLECGLPVIRITLRKMPRQWHTEALDQLGAKTHSRLMVSHAGGLLADALL